MIEWPDLKFQPVNLWNAPMQEIDYMRAEVQDIEKGIQRTELSIQRLDRFSKFQAGVKETAERRLKELEFIYYTRTGLKRQ